MRHRFSRPRSMLTSPRPVHSKEEHMSKIQSGWRSCPKCQGMHFAGFPGKGVCPAGGQHDQTNSFAYAMEFDSVDSAQAGAAAPTRSSPEGSAARSSLASLLGDREADAAGILGKSRPRHILTRNKAGRERVSFKLCLRGSGG